MMAVNVNKVKKIYFNFSLQILSYDIDVGDQCLRCRARGAKPKCIPINSTS